MELEQECLLHLIETARVNLNNSAKYKSLTDPCILEMSQHLDHLINKYYSIMKSCRGAS